MSKEKEIERVVDSEEVQDSQSKEIVPVEPKKGFLKRVGEKVDKFTNTKAGKVALGVGGFIAGAATIIGVGLGLSKKDNSDLEVLDFNNDAISEVPDNDSQE